MGDIGLTLLIALPMSSVDQQYSSELWTVDSSLDTLLAKLLISIADSIATQHS